MRRLILSILVSIKHSFRDVPSVREDVCKIVKYEIREVGRMVARPEGHFSDLRAGRIILAYD